MFIRFSFNLYAASVDSYSIETLVNVVNIT